MFLWDCIVDASHNVPAYGNEINGELRKEPSEFLKVRLLGI